MAALLPVESLQDLWNGFNTTRVAFLDLSKMEVLPESGLQAVGPRGCLAGDLHLVPGQFGASSQVRFRIVSQLKTRSNMFYPCFSMQPTR